MKRILGWIILAAAVTGCQKAPESTRIGGPGALSPAQVTSSTGIQFNGVVYNQSASVGQFTASAQKFMAWIIDPSYVGSVSGQGGDTGIFVGGHIELTSGQPLYVSNGSEQIAANSQIAIYVKDSFPGVSNLAPLPVRLMSSANGYVTGNTAHIVFSDSNGTVTIDGSFNQSVAQLNFSYNNQRDFDGKQGTSENIGVLYVPKCSFFRCQ